MSRSPARNPEGIETQPRRLPIEDQNWGGHPKNTPYLGGPNTHSNNVSVNQQDSYEQFTLGDGEKKIEETIDNRTPSTSIFTLNKEDHTLGNLLRDKLLRHQHVTFAAYKVPHPLFATVELRVQTDGEITPKEAMKSVCRELIVEIQTFKTRFKQAYDLTKMAKGQQNGDV